MPDHILESWTVLAFETIHNCQPVFYLRQMLSRCLDASSIISQTGSGVFHADASRFQCRPGLLELRFVAGQFFNMLLRCPQQCRCRSIAFIEQVESVHRRNVDLLRIGQDTLFGFQPFILAYLKLCIVNLSLLECPQVKHTQAILFVAFEIFNASTDVLPFRECLCSRVGLSIAKRVE